MVHLLGGNVPIWQTYVSNRVGSTASYKRSTYRCPTVLLEFSCCISKALAPKALPTKGGRRGLVWGESSVRQKFRGSDILEMRDDEGNFNSGTWKRWTSTIDLVSIDVWPYLKMIQFDEHIFQTRFHHQLDMFSARLYTEMNDWNVSLASFLKDKRSCMERLMNWFDLFETGTHVVWF